MALDSADLVRVSNEGPFPFFKYRSADAIATIVGANYFDSAYEKLGGNGNPGAVILVVGSYGGTETVDLLVGDSSTAGVVTVVNGT